jgi:hypothetical protein
MQKDLFWEVVGDEVVIWHQPLSRNQPEKIGCFLEAP